MPRRESAPAADTTGAIEPQTLYLAEELKRRAKIGSWALRSARRDGLRIIRKCGRNWIYGQHFIDWLLSGQGGQP